MSRKQFDFEEKLGEGEKWEREAAQRLRACPNTDSVERVSFSEQPEKQLSGVDIVVDGNFNVDVKAQDLDYYNTGNLPIETVSRSEYNDCGWLYEQSIDGVMWVYYDENEDVLLDRWMLLYRTDGFVNWFCSNIMEYRRCEIDNGDWTTVVRLVPFDEIPSDYLIRRDDPAEKTFPSEIDRWRHRV